MQEVLGLMCNRHLEHPVSMERRLRGECLMNILKELPSWAIRHSKANLLVIHRDLILAMLTLDLQSGLIWYRNSVSAAANLFATINCAWAKISSSDVLKNVSRRGRVQKSYSSRKCFINSCWSTMIITTIRYATSSLKAPIFQWFQRKLNCKNCTFLAPLWIAMLIVLWQTSAAAPSFLMQDPSNRDLMRDYEPISPKQDEAKLRSRKIRKLDNLQRNLHRGIDP